MSVLEKKQERSKAKTAVTLASRRLIGAAHRDAEYDVLKNLMTELEKVYDDFWVVNEEFELIVLQDENSEHGTVNGENVSEYRDNVKKCYEEAREVFLTELSLISSSQSTQDVLLQGEINDIIGKAYGQLRAIKLHVQGCQNTNTTPSSVYEDSQTVEVPSHPSTNVENPTSPDI